MVSCGETRTRSASARVRRAVRIACTMASGIGHVDLGCHEWIQGP